MTVLTGYAFKVLAAKNSWELVKYLESNDLSRPQSKHHNFHYTLGENIIPPEEVVLDINEPCSAGGLYFTFAESKCWMRQYCYHVTVPDDASVLIEENDKFKTDKLILLNEMDENWYMKMVKNDGWMLQFIENPTKQMCLAAVENDGTALQFVKNQTEDICLAAVENSAFALDYVKNPTSKICTTAFKKNMFVLQYMENQTEFVCIEAVKYASFLLRFVKNPTEAVRRAAEYDARKYPRFRSQTT